jgi:D-3-phosphoglycerate dehydrogenase
MSNQNDISLGIFIVDEVHPRCGQILSNAGFRVYDHPGISKEELLKNSPYIYGIVIRSNFPLTGPILQAMPAIRVIGRVGAGLENIDTAFAESNGVLCLNSPEGNRDAVGEQAVGMLLSLFNKIPQAHAQMCQGIWNRLANRGEELQGKTVGIIGFGNMGSSFAQKLQGFGVRILAHDKYKTGFGNSRVGEASLEDLFREADILSFHVPLTPETIYMGNAAFFSRFRNPIYLINTARGKVVQTSDLVQALKEKKILGACLDVLEFEDFGFEKLSHSLDLPEMQYLIASENVLLSPHIAGWTHQSNQKMAEVIAEKIIAGVPLPTQKS